MVQFTTANLENHVNIPLMHFFPLSGSNSKVAVNSDEMQYIYINITYFIKIIVGNLSTIILIKCVPSKYLSIFHVTQES